MTDDIRPEHPGAHLQDDDVESAPPSPVPDRVASDDYPPAPPTPPAEEEAPREEAPVRLPHKLNRKDVLARLHEKNEAILKLTREKTAHEKQFAEVKDRWLRSVAEFENYRKRTRKEWDLLRHQAKGEIILEVLTVADDFERAFAAAERAGSGGILDGIRLIYNNLIQTLDRAGVSELQALHTPFDPRLHMAVGQIEVADVESGSVAEVVQKGYLFDDAILRPAHVIVAK